LEITPSQADLALDSEVLHTFWRKALATLQSLQTPLGVMASGRDDQFHAIFGRDSLWTVLLALETGRLLQEKETQPGGRHASSLWDAASYRNWMHELAASVLRGLASLQGRVVNDVNEEQPGRIVHEYWDPVPQRMIVARWPVIDGRYYGAFDATFLFIIYNPFMYHCGAVWPFDNAVIAAGLQRYGFNPEARRVAHTILQAFLAIDDPVELYVVLPSSWIRSPRIEQAWALVDYFYASGVQAWTAAAILYLASLLLYG
jgi:glycogen debranching enzyme